MEVSKENRFTELHLLEIFKGHHGRKNAYERDVSLEAPQILSEWKYGSCRSKK